MTRRASKKGTPASRTAQWLPPQVAELLDLALAAAKVTEKSYAIGGALAMGAHGYRRHTEDIDVYVAYDDRGTWVRALGEQGLVVTPLMSGIHYMATLPKHQSTTVRIDLLVPADEPDISAIEAPDEATILGRPVLVFPRDLLVIAKYQSDRDSDRIDVKQMQERGLVDAVAVHKLIRLMGDKDLATEFWMEYGR